MRCEYAERLVGNIAGIITIPDTPTSCPACDGGSAGECAGPVQSRAQFQSAAGQLQEDEDEDEEQRMHQLIVTLRRR